MKLIRFGKEGAEKPGIIEDDIRYDASEFREDWSETFFGNDGINRLNTWWKENKSHCPVVNENERWAAPITRPSKIICIGLNYSDHARETGAVPPSEPIIFFKSTTALCGPNDDLILPKNSTKMDWEVELAIVIGKKASYVEEDDAVNYIAGYCLHNDYSERAFQMERGGQWVKGKSADTFAPLGPWLTTKDEINDVHNLRLWLTVNGKTMQDGTTSNLIFNVPFVVSYCSQFMTLLPGDVISTGTPAGVGLGMKPPVYLKAGDVVESGVDDLGMAKQTARDYSPA